MKLSKQVLDTLRRNFATRFMAKHPLILGNNCLSSYVYSCSQSQFNTPFVWSVVSPKDILFLMNNFWDIDFNDVEFSLVQQTTQNFSKEYVKACISKKVDIHFIHYITHIEGKGTRNNLVSDEILDIAKEKYFNRLQRMMQMKGNANPFFMVYINSSEDMKLKGFENAIHEMGNRKDVHIIYQRTNKSDNTFKDDDYSNLFIYDRKKKTRIQEGMLYTLLEYLNDQCN